MQDRCPEQEREFGYSIFAPLLLVGITLLVIVVLQATQLVRERDNLQALKASQDVPLSESRKVRAQLDSLVKGTAKLAANGNANAQRLLEQLKKTGITVRRSTGSPHQRKKEVHP